MRVKAEQSSINATTAVSTDPGKNRDEIVYLSFLSVISALAVVFFHFNCVYWAHPAGWTWISANVIESFFYFAVPIFFMISGCTLIDYKNRYTTREFFIKRAKKVLIPFLFWSGVAFLSIALTDPTIRSHTTIRTFLSGIFNTEYISTYWFFMPLFSVYLCMPVLTEIQNKRKTFLYIVLLGFFLNEVPAFLAEMGLSIMPGNLNFPLCATFLIYPVLGYLLHHSDLPKRWRLLIYAGGIVSFLSHLVVTVWLTPEGGTVCGLFKGYTKPPAIIQACAVFLFVKDELQPVLKCRWCKRAVRFFRSATFGVYLLHMYVHHLFLRVGWIDTASIYYRTIFPLIAFVGLSCFIRACQRSKWGAIVLPK